MKKLLRYGGVLLCALLIPSCNVGLGESVDTEAPAVAITYPPSLATIRKTFVLGGTWSDDKSIKSVSVSVNRVESDDTSTLVYSDIAALDEKTWKINLNSYDAEKYSSTNGWQFADGSYVISVEATDNAGHTTSDSKTYTIDNTAPVLVLTKPTTVGSNTAKAYGRTVQLEGSFSEGCSTGISELIVSFYDSTGSKLFDSSFENITDMSNANPLVVAQYYDSSEEPSSSSDNYRKWENYQSLYTSSAISSYRESGTADSTQFYFTVSASDAAKVYQTMGDSGVAGGNVTETYYRGTTEMLNLINAKNSSFPDFNVSVLRSYLNGTDTTYIEDSDLNTELKTILQAAASSSQAGESIASSISNTSTDSGNVYLTFSISPANNPTYTISGFSIDETTSDTDNYTDGYYHYYADSPVNASVSVGLDGTNIDTGTVSIFYTRVSNDDDANTYEPQLFWTWDYDVALSYAVKGGLTEAEAKANITASPKTYRYTVTSDGENSDSLSVSSSLSATEVNTGYKYVFSISGKDINSQAVSASSSSGFGFMVKSNASVPVIKTGTENGYENPATQSAFTGGTFLNGKIGFSGTVSSSEEVVSKSYKLTLADSKDSSNSVTSAVAFNNEGDTFALEDGTSYSYDWSFDIIPTDAMKKIISKGSGLYNIDLVISVTNGGGTSSLQRTYFLDTTAPAVQNVTVSNGYTASDGTIYINNKNTFTLSGTTTDNYLVGSTSYNFAGIGSDGKALSKSSAENSEISWSFENVDLSSFAVQENAADIVLTVTALDKAGNETSSVYNIEIDTTAPAGKHIYDAKNKDLVFRFGEADNELSELTSYDSSITELDETLDKDVGGKYKYDSWNNAQTVTLRGDWTEEGSGISMIYYKFYTSAPTDEELAAFKKNYATLKSGYFSPSIEDEDKTKRVSYTDSDGSRKFTEVTSCFKQIISGLSAGNNYVVFVAKDNVGNVGLDTLEASCIYDAADIDETGRAWNGGLEAVSLNIDVESPSAVCDQSGTVYTNTVNAITVSGTASDNASGVSAIKLTVNSRSVSAALKTADGDTDTSLHWTAEIPADYLSALSSSSTYPVSMTVTDSAGNQNANTAFTLQVDTSAPVSSIATPAASTESGETKINGTVSASGTVTYEGAVPEKLVLCYSLSEPSSTTTLENLTKIGEITDSSKIYSWSFSGVDVKAYSLVTEESPSAAIYLVPVVYDTAGNCNIYKENSSGTRTYSFTEGTNYFAYTVDQNADRPVIQIKSIDNASSWLKSKTVQGTVSDDDGISSFAVSEDGSSYTDVTVSNGAWSYTIKSDDGENLPLYFKVKDTAGTTFTTAAASKFERPYYTFAGTSSSDEGYAEYGFDNTQAVTVKLDTNSPYLGTAGLVIGKSYKVYSDTNTDGLQSAEEITGSDGSVSSAYEISAGRYAGGDYKYVRFYVPAFDANLSSVTVSISDASSSENETSSYKTVGSDGAETAIEGSEVTLSASKVGKTIDKVTYTYYQTDVISVAGISGAKTKNVTFSVKDAAGNETSSSKTFYVDNEVGEDCITITSPASADEVTGTVNVVGTATDTGIGIDTIEWLVPPLNYSSQEDSVLSALDGWTSSNNTKTTAVFNFKFLSGDTTDLVNFDDTAHYDVTYDSSKQIYTIPLYLRATDKLGNIYIKRDFYITHNPDADRPVTEISYPTSSDYDSGNDYVTLSGSIRVNGIVEIPSGTTSVGSVYIQLGTVDASGNISWTKDNSSLSAEFTSLGGVISKSGLTAYENLTYVDDDWWGIPCTTKTSTWNIMLNSEGNLNPEGGNATTNIAVRACAVNEDGKMGLWTDSSIIHVDSNAPSQSAVMRQYSEFKEASPEESVSVEKDYLSEMYLKGTWYLVVTLEDNDSLSYSSIKVKRGSASTEFTALKDTDLSDETNGVSNTLYIPIKTEDMTTSSVSYTVYAEDSAGHSSSLTYTFYIDNTAPELSSVSGNGTEFETDKENSVGDSDYVYTVSGKVKDSGSGYARVLFYFVRNGQIYGTSSSFKNEYVLDPLVTKWKSTESAKASVKDLTALSVGTYTLYAKEANGTVSSSGTSGEYIFTDSGSAVSGNNHIHAGGLIYINGEFGKITNVSSSAVKFTMDANPASSASLTVYFPYAQSVDNTSTEDVASTTANPFTFSSGDDGDLMPESITNVSTTWTWKGTIHSTNIPDGPAYLVVLAMDSAGNVSGETYPVSVVNNAPRLAKLYLGTDLNSDATFASDEFSGYNVYNADTTAGISTTGYKAAAAITTANFDAGQFTAKDKLAVVPEITGGNGSVHMVYKRGASSVSAVDKSDGSGLKDASSSVETDKLSVINEGDALYAFELSSDEVWQGLTADPEGDAGVSFTFWDETEERTAGTDSQYCVAWVKDLIINLADSTAPVVTIDPFYWNSKSDNSLYSNSTSNGHIELEADWKKASGYSAGASSGTEDGDPKISGKIKITGTAFDNKMLKTISLSAGGFSFNGTSAGSSFDFANYDGTEWTLTSGNSSAQGGGDIANDGWQFEINSETLTQGGHTVKWTLYLDTEEVSSIAQTDTEVNAAATDWASKTKAESDLVSASSTEQTAAKAKTSYYRMDIVPYVAGVKTGLSSVKKSNSSLYDRTALGHYSASYDETIYVYGFNLAGGTLYDSASATATLTAMSDVTGAKWYSSSAVPAGSVYSAASIKNFTSGEVYVKVNGVESLNNKNANDSAGDYTSDETIGTTGNKTVYENYYNRQPNGDSNNLLTDDLVLDVWEFRTAAKPISGKIEQPVMKINPAGDNEIGFAFVNGPLYFSMPGGVDVGSEYSYYYWIGSYDFFTSVGLAYDSLGHSYAVSAGGDINSSSADHWNLMSSRWGISTRGQSGSYGQNNVRSLESIGLTSSGTILFDKQRIKSPALATASAASDSTNLYIAYYDAMNGQVRFRSGSVKAARKDTTEGFTDTTTQGTPPQDSAGSSYRSLIAGGSGNAGKGAGEYVSIGAIEGGGNNDDLVMAVWYDQTERCLWYNYTTVPNSNRGTTDGTGWSTPVQVFTGDLENAGEYCQLAVDGNKGVHIAAYDPVNCDLVYAYLPSSKGGKASSSSDFAACVVDSNGVIGSNLTIDVSLESSGGKAVPRIGYYGTSCIRPKYAYPVNGISSSSDVEEGSSDDAFTGNWECSVVPTSSTVSMQSNQYNKMNVGVWKDTTGVKKSPAKTGTNSQTTTGSGYNSNSYGYAYSNSSGNPVMGYVVKVDATTDEIQTAQMQ